MRNLEIAGRHLAKAIKSCNGNRITQEAAKSAWAAAMLDCAAAKLSPGDTADTLDCWMNLSATNQELERHGLVKTDRAVPALISSVKAELAKLK